MPNKCQLVILNEFIFLSINVLSLNVICQHESGNQIYSLRTRIFKKHNSFELYSDRIIIIIKCYMLIDSSEVSTSRNKPDHDLVHTYHRKFLIPATSQSLISHQN
jgi:hypothetical protein